jgi:ubiquinone/menaquinone biosynthesis C-methylase UbiE
LAEHFAVEVIGIDPSQKMLDQARHRPGTGTVSYRQGPAEAIPLPYDCADLIFMSMIYHHLTDLDSVATECHRVLRQGGVRNGTQETDFPQRHSFPGLQPLIDSQLPSRQDIKREFAAGGFTSLVHCVVTQVVAPDWLRFVEKSAHRADSFLARLSNEDFEHGMAALRSPGDGVDRNAAVTEEIDWFVFQRRG